MKTTKILAAVLGLFLMVNVNVALAQETERNDSIYGMENLSISDRGVISFKFYSTYEIMDLKFIHLDFYDTISDELLGNGMLSCSKYAGHMYFVYPITGRTWGNYTNNIPGIYEIDIEYPLYMEFIELMGKPLKIEFYLEGEGFVPPSNNLRAGEIGRSNVLTFYYDPLTTSLTELESNKNYTHKYFLLSGIESKAKPIGVPFIQVTYKNGKPVAYEKYMTIE